MRVCLPVFPAPQQRAQCGLSSSCSGRGQPSHEPGKEAAAGQTPAPAPQDKDGPQESPAWLGTQVRRSRGHYSQGQRQGGIATWAGGEQGPWRSPRPCWALPAFSVTPSPLANLPLAPQTELSACRLLLGRASFLPEGNQLSHCCPCTRNAAPQHCPGHAGHSRSTPPRELPSKKSRHGQGKDAG